MQRQDLNHVNIGKLESSAAEMRQQGLRTLARMIAVIYVRDIRSRNTGGENACGEISSGHAIRRAKSKVCRVITEKKY